MNILSSIKENGVVVGYNIQDGDFVLPMCNRALYTELYIEPLTSAGYKYYSYDANEIEDPTGNLICEMTSVDISEIDETEWAASLDFAETDALPEAQVAKYYTFREEATIQFLQSGNYTIHTREQLIAYLDSLKRAFYGVSYSVDNRPLNYFVHPDALFTIDEINQNKELLQYFDVIFKRHHFRNYQSYQDLIKWLMEQGVLNNPNPSQAEFLKAYYAWGPEGLRDKCVKTELKLNVDGMFYFMKDPLGTSSPEAYVFDNRIKKPAVIDANSRISYLDKSTDLSTISDVHEFGRSSVIVTSNEQIMSIRRAQNTGKRFQVVGNASVSDVSDRYYIGMISESGYNYTYKVSHNKVKIGLSFSDSGNTLISCNNNFSIATLIPSVNIPVFDVRSNDEYFAWNMALLKAANLIESKTVKPGCNSTSEFLIKDGVTPITAINMMAHDVSRKGAFRVNQKYALSQKDDDMTDALELYLKDLPDYLLAAFNLTIEDCENGVESFLELADVDDLMDRRDAMMENRITPGMPGFDETFKDYQTKFAKEYAQVSAARAAIGLTSSMYDAVDYYTKLKFVSDCLHGAMTVNNFGDGKLSDMGASLMTAAEIMMSAVIAYYGGITEDAIEELKHMESSDLIDVLSIFKMRDNAHKGYMIDFAEYRKYRACKNTWIWAYCTKVFREISNAPIEQQRPYLMEMVCLENSKPDVMLRDLMTECVRLSMEKANFDEKVYGKDDTMINWSDKICASHSTEWIAARLFFFIYAGGVKTEPVDGAYIIPIHLYDDVNLEVSVPVDVYNFIKTFNADSHRKYMTVYDYCKYEYNPNTAQGTFNICLVNADVDPWHVKPKKGYSIKTYNLMANYQKADALNQANGEGWYEQASESKAICVSPLKESYKVSFLPTSEFAETQLAEMEVRNAAEPEDLNGFLSADVFEFIFAYVRRWALEKKRAMALGKRLVSIPLKQDIVYGAMAPLYCTEIPPTTPVYTDAYIDDRAAYTDINIGKISWKDFVGNSTIAIEMKHCSFEPFVVNKFTVDELANIRDIIVDANNVGSGVHVSGNFINFATDTDTFRLLATNLGDQQIADLVEAGIIRPISDKKYFLCALNGNYVLEVL